MLPARVGRFLVLCLVVVTPADHPALAGHGPLFAALSHVPATQTSRIETIVDRFAPVGPRLHDETETLAADDDIGLLADTFDSVGVDQAAFSTDSFRFANHDGVLLQYRAVATGTGRTKDGAFMAIAFAEPDHTAAVEQAKRLDAVAHTGTNITARRPWSDVLVVERIEARGRIVLAVLPTRLDTLWLELERTPDTLLWWSQ